MIYNYLTLKNIDVDENGLIYASYFNKNLQKLYKESIDTTDLNYFGHSNDDLIEISIYNVDDNLIYFGNVIPSISYSILSGKYNNIENKEESYRVIKSFVNFLRYDGTILLNTEDLLTQTGVCKRGVNKVLYNFLRNVAGNSTHRLIIKEISPSRTELKLSLEFNKTDSESALLDSIKISSFANKKYLLLNVDDLIQYIIENNPIFQSFNSNTQNYNYYEIAQLLGIKDLAKLQEFLNDIYVGKDILYEYKDNNTTVINESSIEGISRQLLNFSYSYNSIELSKDEILTAYETIIRSLIQQHILKRTSLSKDKLELITNAFLKIIYVDWIEPQVTQILNDYSDRFFGYYKNALNFDNGNLYKIVTHTSYYNEINKSYNVQVKLDQPLPSNLSIKSTCWISNISIVPVYFNVNLFSEPISKKVKLVGVNFNADAGFVHTAEELYKTTKTPDNTLQHTIFNLQEKLNDLSINYNSFDNFVVYSSAEIRTRLAKNKIEKYYEYQSNINSIIDDVRNLSSSEDGFLTNNNKIISSSYVPAYDREVNDQNELLKSFDEYESYLFFNNFTSETFDSIIDRAVEYDTHNKDSLINQLPDYLKNDNDSQEYIKFTSMIGHFFDSLLLYIKKFPKLYSVDKYDYPKMYLDEFLNTHNWISKNNRIQNSNLYKYLFGDITSDISYFEYGKEILNRFANNLSYIYKTSGTQKSLEVLRTIFGIPSELIQIREYGNADFSTTTNNYYDFDSLVYLTNFTSNEYLKFEYDCDDYSMVKTNEEFTYKSGSTGTETVYYQTSSVQTFTEQYTGLNTLEFTFKINTSEKYLPNDVIVLVTKERELNNPDWRLTLTKTPTNNFGILTLTNFMPDRTTVSVKSKALPFFNGDLFSVFITNNPARNIDYIDTIDPIIIQEEYSNTSSKYVYEPEKYVPRKIELIVNQYDGYLNNFTSHEYMNVDYHEDYSFSSGSYYIGNYFTPVSFNGNIDKIKLYNFTLDIEDIKEHSYNIESISISNKDKLYESLIYLWSFDTPIELSSDTNVVTVKNCNEYYKESEKFGVVYAHNFKPTYIETDCGPTKTSKFPYQFTSLSLKQALNANNFSPNYKNNVKINKIEEYVYAGSNLTPYDYSTHSDTIIGGDSNIVGFYISPFLYLENCIENFLGKEGISDIVGDPINLKIKGYPKLKERIRQFGKLNKKYVYPQEFYTLYKLYIDFSIFDYIDKIIPARVALKKGMILESTQLERLKINCRNVSINDIFNESNTQETKDNIKNNNGVNGSVMLSFKNYLDKSVTNSFLNLNTKPNLCIVDNLTENLNVPLQSTPHTDYYQFNYNCLSIPYEVDDRNYITSTNTVYYTNINDKFIKTKLMTVDKIISYTNIVNGNPVVSKKKYKKLELIPLNVNEDENNLQNIGGMSLYSGSYSQRHLSKFIEVGSRNTYIAINGKNEKYRYIKGQNTSNTTINRNGDYNGSEPIISIPGFLSLRNETKEFPKYGYVSEIGDSSEFVSVPLTASAENSSSLEMYIQNL